MHAGVSSLEFQVHQDKYSLRYTEKGLFVVIKMYYIITDELPECIAERILLICKSLKAILFIWIQIA